jgi:phospholipid/cholesterol/gamma-HCH transport system substrate-binding protein
MKKASIEAGVGFFVLIGIICMGYLTIKLGKMELVGSENYYPVTAKFQSVAGLKPGAQVEIAGVQIGQVESITLDPDILVAQVKMMVQKKVKLSEDVIASVKTSGLIGDKYIELSPGGSEFLIEPGGIITETESSLDIEELVNKYVFGDKS